jgi:CRP-like cAMP-binding protein
MKEGELGKGYRDGEVIFREGDKGELMYVIQAGRVRIKKDGPSGEITLGMLESGEIFGEMALFDRLPRSATAVASGDARILSVDRKKLFPTISKDPTLLFKILETMSQRIRRLNEEIAKLKKEQSGLPPVCGDITKTYRTLLNEVKAIIPAESGSVMLMDEQEQYLSINSAFGLEAGEKLMLRPGEGIAGNVLATGTAALIDNVSTDPRFVPGATKITSMLCVPIGCEGRNFGVINLSNASEKNFTQHDLKLLRTLSMYAALAIKSEELSSHLKNSIDELIKNAAVLR